MIKRILSRFILLSMLITLVFLGVRSIGNTRKLGADSGFDYSYDSGGSSWSGGSSYDSGWSSSSYHSSSSDGSYSGDGSLIDVFIYMGFIFISFVVSSIKAVSEGRAKSSSEINRPKTLNDKLYDKFYDVHKYINMDKYDSLKELVTDDFYNKVLSDKQEMKENVVSHDNTITLESSNTNITMEFILKVALYKIVNGEMKREECINKNKYIVEFIKVNNDWIIQNIEESFLQKVDYKPFGSSGASQVDISKYVSDKEQFLKDRYDDYVAIQEAWMNFDYDVLNDKLTNELYNQYEMQLETLKVKHERNVMKDFTNNGIVINNVVEENGIVTVNLVLHVSQIDYIEKDGKCVRGKSGKINHVDYNLTFISNLDTKEKKCPNCGNPLDDISSQTCKFCHSKITLTPNKWVMSKKQIKSQR